MANPHDLNDCFSTQGEIVIYPKHFYLCNCIVNRNLAHIIYLTPSNGFSCLNVGSSTATRFSILATAVSIMMMMPMCGRSFSLFRMVITTYLLVTTTIITMSMSSAPFLIVIVIIFILMIAGTFETTTCTRRR
jgi:hypothetical protein